MTTLEQPVRRGERPDPMLCKFCGESKPLTEFRRRRRDPGGVGTICRECDRKNTRAARARDETYRWREILRWRRLRDENPDLPTWAGNLSPEQRREKSRLRYARRDHTDPKERARGVLRAAVGQGKVQKPDACQSCRKQPGRAQIHGHHHNGYANPLDVLWLCSYCHGLAHRSPVPTAAPARRDAHETGSRQAG
jgi:hypothetical protein